MSECGPGCDCAEKKAAEAKQVEGFMRRRLKGRRNESIGEMMERLQKKP